MLQGVSQGERWRVPTEMSPRDNPVVPRSRGTGLRFAGSLLAPYLVRCRSSRVILSVAAEGREVEGPGHRASPRGPPLRSCGVPTAVRAGAGRVGARRLQGCYEAPTTRRPRGSVVTRCVAPGHRAIEKNQVQSLARASWPARDSRTSSRALGPPKSRSPRHPRRAPRWSGLTPWAASPQLWTRRRFELAPVELVRGASKAATRHPRRNARETPSPRAVDLASAW